MSRSAFLLGAGGAVALLAVLFLLPSVHAAAPPQAVVIQANSSTPQAFPPGTVTVLYNFTWRASSDDPDPVNGSLNYVIWYNTTTVARGWLTIYNSTNPDKVPLHPGWFQTSLSFMSPELRYDVDGGTSLARERVLNMTVWNDTDKTMGLPSCIVLGQDAPNYYTPEGQTNLSGVHDQCGDSSFLKDVPGVAAQVQIPSSTGNSSTLIRWNVSASDLNQTAGNLTYRLFVYTPAYNVSRPAANVGADPVSGADVAGIRQFWFNTSGTAPATLFIQLRAEDPLSRQWANLSCVVSVDTSQIYGESSCGLMGNVGPAGVAGPSFPLIADVSGLAGTMGISTDALGWILGGIGLMSAMIGGFAVARFAGAAAGGIIGTAVVALMGLFPLWLIIVLFLVSVSFIGVEASGGGAG